MNLCETCAYYLGLNYSGEKVRCKKRGTKRARAWNEISKIISVDCGYLARKVREYQNGKTD